MKSLIALISLCILGESLAADLIIESPITTDWGDWHPWENCSSGQYVHGMRLKTEEYQGILEDDTALNGIRLYCDYPGSWGNQRYITSAESLWGYWGNDYFCYGPVTGFQIRSEPYLGSGDDTATNNVRIFCNDNRDDYIQGDGTDYGFWTNARHCNTRQAFCGISVQIEPQQQSDDTASNNFRIKCCDIASPVEECTPTDEWKRILICDNSEGSKPKVCKYEQRVGSGYSHQRDPERPFAKEYYKKVGFTLEEDLPLLQKNLRDTLSGAQEELALDWAGIKDKRVWGLEKATLGSIEAPPHSRLSLYQAVGNCGIYSTHTHKMKRVIQHSLTKAEKVSYFEI